MQYFHVKPVATTAGSPPESMEAEAMAKHDVDLEDYVYHMLELLRSGKSPTSARTDEGYMLLATGGVGDDEDGWITNCGWVEDECPGIHKLLGIRIEFTADTYGSPAGSVG